MNRATLGEKAFYAFNYILLGSLAILSLLPLINILVVSLSSNSAVAANKVGLWPVDFNIKSYVFAMVNDNFWSSFLVSIKRVFVGVPFSMFLIILTAYPLSKTKQIFKGRGFFAWFFMISILFSGGLIPYYLTVSSLHLVDTFWSLIIPCSVQVFYIIILLNFFRQIPSEMSEAAEIDGAGHFRVLIKIMIPLSIPALATLVLLTFIFHWNSWFDGLLFIGYPDKQPLQSYLQTIISRPLNVMDFAKDPEQWKIISSINERTLKSAQIIIAMIPIAVIYPFCQRYFVKGMMIGAVKA